jgi:hypothetical protein
MPPMKISSLLAPLLAAAVAHAADGPGPYTFTLAGKAFGERCLDLAAGESIRYRFRASGPVDFNIHHHRGKDVFYPVRQRAIREADATFRADTAGTYCLMWELAGSGSIAVDGVVERMPGR